MSLNRVFLGLDDARTCELYYHIEADNNANTADSNTDNTALRGLSYFICLDIGRWRYGVWQNLSNGKRATNTQNGEHAT